MLVRDAAVWSGRKQRGGVDQDIRAPEGHHRLANGGADRAAIADVDRGEDSRVRAGKRCDFEGDRPGRVGIKVADGHVAALAGGQHRCLPANSVSSADDDEHLTAEFLLGRLPAKLGVLELPVFDVESLGQGQGYIVAIHLESLGWRRAPRLWQGLRQGLRGRPVAERRRSFHDVNGVEVKFARDPSFRLALAEAEHAHAGDQHDGRVRVAHGGGIGFRVLLVVLLVFPAIAAKRTFDRGPQLLAVSAFGIPGRKERADLGAHKMVGAARAETREPLGVARIDESQDLRRVGKVSDHPPLSGHVATKKRKQVGGYGARVGARPVNLPSEKIGSRLLDAFLNELSELVDERDGAEVTLPLALAPGKQPVSAEHDAVRARM